MEPRISQNEQSSLQRSKAAMLVEEVQRVVYVKGVIFRDGRVALRLMLPREVLAEAVAAPSRPLSHSG